MAPAIYCDQLTHGVRAHVDYALCAMYYVRVRSNYSVVGTSYLYYVPRTYIVLFERRQYALRTMYYVRGTCTMYYVPMYIVPVYVHMY